MGLWCDSVIRKDYTLGVSQRLVPPSDHRE